MVGSAHRRYMKTHLSSGIRLPACLLKGAPAWVLLVCAVAPESNYAQMTKQAISELQGIVADGSAALTRGDYPDAERDFAHALVLAPRSVPIMNNLGIALARQSREQEAIATYLRALQLEPDDAATGRNLGLAYFRAHAYAQALPLLEKFADDARSYQAFDLAGLDLFALDRYAEAIPYLESAQKIEPRNVETLDVLGKAYLRTKNYSGMTWVFSRIMASDPASPEAHAMLAMAYDKLYREADAIKEFEAALAVDPKYPGLHTGLGVIYWRNDQMDGAEREFREELALHPQDPVANCTLGRILRRRNKVAEAVPYLEAALAVNPAYRDALMELGHCEIWLEEPIAAIEHLRRAIALDANDAEAHYVLGTALSKAGRSADGAKERATSAQLQDQQRK